MLTASGTYAVMLACVCMYVCVSVCVTQLVNASPQSLYMVQLSYGGTLTANGPQMCTWVFFFAAKVTQGQIWPIIAKYSKTSSDKV